MPPSPPTTSSSSMAPHTTLLHHSASHPAHALPACPPPCPSALPTASSSHVAPPVLNCHPSASPHRTAPHLPKQAHFRVSRSSQHLIQPDDAAAYYGPCDPPPAKCPRPRGFNLEADLFNITPYHRFKEFYRYKGKDRAGQAGEGVVGWSCKGEASRQAGWEGRLGRVGW